MSRAGAVTRLRETVTWRWASGLGWVAFVLVTQSWRPWNEGITRQYATDIISYERIARAAPGFPSGRVDLQHAERFVPHWLVGVLADAANLPLHDVYRVATGLALLALFAVVDATLAAARVGRQAHVLALGLLIASAYPVHYLLAAPGMFQDAVFLLGLAVVLLGFAVGRFPLVLTGLLVGTLGRQNMVPLGLAVAAWIWWAPAWRGRRTLYAATAAIAPAVLYVVLHEVSAGFAQRHDPVSSITVLGSLGDPRALVEHVARTVLSLLVPLAVLVGAALRAPGRLPRGPLLLGGLILGETLVLGPTWAAHSEPRLAALALPPIVVAAGVLLSRAPLDTWRAATVAVCIALASMHHLYTRLPTERSAAWALLSILAAALALGALLLPSRRRAASAEAAA